jgi:hypothetical protein
MLKLVFWTLAAIALPLAVVVGIWMSTASGYFIRVHDLTFDPETGVMTLQRSVLSRDDVLARWHVAVQIPHSRRECSDSGVDIYEPRYVDGTEKTEVSFPAGSLAECLADPEAQVVASWQVLWFGFIPLKPTYFFKPPRS